MGDLLASGHDPRLVIEGGRRLTGTVRVSGAKNAILPMLAGTILTAGPCRFQGVPEIRDVTVMTAILKALGARVAWTGSDSRRPGPGPASGGYPGGNSVLEVRFSEPPGTEVPPELMGEMRSSLFVMGPLLGRVGRARVSMPGGCAIGPRPIDLHLRGLEALGARIEERGGHIEATAPRLRGAEIHLDVPSVGATENIMMAAVLAEGTTVISNAAKEPEIVDLQNFLNQLGAKIRGAGRDTIRVTGVRELSGGEHAIIPDRIEAGTFLVAGAITRGEVILENVISEHLEAIIAKLRETGAEIEEDRDGMRLSLRMAARPRAVDFTTLPYPGFPTDLQAQAMALMTVADGASVIVENVFERRFAHAGELRRMGAQVKTDGRVALVSGIDRLSGATVTASDLRAGAALVLAGLAAEGETAVHGALHIQRGYERFHAKLRGLGAQVAVDSGPMGAGRRVGAAVGGGPGVPTFSGSGGTPAAG